MWIPLSAATATTALSFFPIAAGQGPSAEFVGGMAKTVILSITSSLFLALYVVPVLLNYLDQIKFWKKKSLVAMVIQIKNFFKDIGYFDLVI